MTYDSYLYIFNMLVSDSVLLPCSSSSAFGGCHVLLTDRRSSSSLQSASFHDINDLIVLPVRDFKMFVLVDNPLCAGNSCSTVEQLVGSINIQDLAGLVVLKDGVPSSSGTPASGNLSTLLNGLRTTAFTRTAIPGPVDARLGATRIVDYLEQTLPGLMFTNKPA